MQSKEKHNRRRFIKSILTAGTATGLIAPAGIHSKPPGDNKIKMLTADGKLVEVDRSVLEKNEGLKRASDKEVFEWMSDKHKS